MGIVLVITTEFHLPMATTNFISHILGAKWRMMLFEMSKRSWLCPNVQPCIMQIRTPDAVSNRVFVRSNARNDGY